MMETIMKIKKMLMEFIIGIMEIYMKENIKMVKRMDSVF